MKYKIDFVLNIWTKNTGIIFLYYIYIVKKKFKYFNTSYFWIPQKCVTYVCNVSPQGSESRLPPQIGLGQDVGTGGAAPQAPPLHDPQAAPPPGAPQKDSPRGRHPDRHCWTDENAFHGELQKYRQVWLILFFKL